MISQLDADTIATMRIVDRTSESARHTHNLMTVPIISRHGTHRPLNAINAVMLHQMNFDRGNDPTLYDRVICHYAVLRDGTVLHLRPLEALLNDSAAYRSVHIEFASCESGQLANMEELESGRAGAKTPTWEQMEAGRLLIRDLWSRFGIRFVYGHRQHSLLHRGNCPGPHIWYNVGHWATYSLGMSTGGAPEPIPDGWLNPDAQVGM